MPDDVPLEAAPRPVSEHVWDRWAVAWDVYYAIVLAATVVIMEVTEHPPANGRILSTVAVAAMVPWWVLVGRHAALHLPYNDRRSFLYVAGLVTALGVAQMSMGSSSLMLFAIAPQCFWLLSVPWATGAVALMNLTPMMGPATQYSAHPAAITAVLGTTVLIVAASGAMGGWIGRIIDQSRERAELIEQLESARAELASVEREAGVLTERQRLATEIHDTLAQGFASVLMLVQAAGAGLDPAHTEVHRRLDLAARTARENLAESRALIAALSPADLGVSTLLEALCRLTERIREELGIAAECETVGGSKSLSPGKEVVLLRCAQESLANVRKHAAASSVGVRLEYRVGTVRLEVTDDGRGFVPGEARGFGLHGMRKRVAQVGGVLDVCSSPGAGTLVRVEVPT